MYVMVVVVIVINAFDIDNIVISWRSNHVLVDGVVQAMQAAGIEGQQVVLLLEDHQFVDPQFLELTNSLLSAGEVPGLYTPEELEPLLAPIKDQASDAGFRGTIAQYFASRMY